MITGGARGGDRPSQLPSIEQKVIFANFEFAQRTFFSFVVIVVVCSRQILLLDRIKVELGISLTNLSFDTNGVSQFFFIKIGMRGEKVVLFFPVTISVLAKR